MNLYSLLFFFLSVCFSLSLHYSVIGLFRPQHYLSRGFLLQSGRVSAAVGGVQLRLQHDIIWRAALQWPWVYHLSFFTATVGKPSTLIQNHLNWFVNGWEHLRCYYLWYSEKRTIWKSYWIHKLWKINTPIHIQNSHKVLHNARTEVKIWDSTDASDVTCHSELKWNLSDP